MRINYKLKPYLFSKPSDTINAAIRLYNSLEMDKEMLSQLLEVFAQENPNAMPPKLYQKVLIPVLREHWDRHGLND